MKINAIIEQEIKRFLIESPDTLYYNPIYKERSSIHYTDKGTFPFAITWDMRVFLGKESAGHSDTYISFEDLFDPDNEEHIRVFDELPDKFKKDGAIEFYNRAIFEKYGRIFSNQKTFTFWRFEWFDQRKDMTLNWIKEMNKKLPQFNFLDGSWFIETANIDGEEETVQLNEYFNISTPIKPTIPKQTNDPVINRFRYKQALNRESIEK